MKVKVYVNWNDEEILSEKEFQNIVEDRVWDIMGDEYDFDQICGVEFGAFELFNMDSKNENDIEKIKSIIRKNTEDDFRSDGWDEIELEI